MRQVFRKEIKYCIEESDFIRIKDHLLAFMLPDPHADKESGSYTVRSLYFDSAADNDLHDNLDGVMEKRKIRVRTYDMDSDFALLEYKCKSGSDSRKLSLVINKEEALLMENGHYEFLLDRSEDLAIFLYDKITRNVYRPRTVVEYDRTAYLYPVSDVRITFDHHVRGSLSDFGLYDPGTPLYPLLPRESGILEVKYNDFLVSPLQRVLARLDLLPASNSKYSNARLLAY
jgi:hypothetical protein